MTWVNLSTQLWLISQIPEIIIRINKSVETLRTSPLWQNCNQGNNIQRGDQWDAWVIEGNALKRTRAWDPYPHYFKEGTRLHRGEETVSYMEKVAQTKLMRPVRES